MGQQKNFGATSWMLIAASWLTVAPPLLAAQESVKLTGQLTAPVVKPWRNVHTPTRNLVELVLPTSARADAPIKARVAITTEAHGDHSAALRRLQEIAAERGGEIRYIAVCGWPAVERRVVIELPRVMATGEQLSQDFQTGPTNTTVVTVAVAAGDSIARYEGVLRPDVPAAVAEDIVGLARRLRCAAKPPAGQTQRELGMLKNTPLQWEPASGPQATPPPQTPTLAVPGFGELQIAVSSDAKNVVVETNFRTSVSVDGGATFTALTALNLTWPFPTRGDPSVGVGAPRGMGAPSYFYVTTIGLPPFASPLPACADSVARSVDGGKNFSFVGHAVVCPPSGNNMCFPDQPQLAVDRTNQVAGKDQLYMVWRSFPNLSLPAPPGCTSFVQGYAAPLISCSVDNGDSWDLQTRVGDGDVGRITVGSDGFVYVTFIAGANLSINKFSSCASGLKQQPNFPHAIAPMSGVFCPVPGLDRCIKEMEASPQPAVDDTDPKHVLVAYADNDGNPDPNENVILLDSHDGGLNWTGRIIMNSFVTARRFLPWLCVTRGISYVTWYDRRLDDLTAYFVNTATGGPLKTGTETDVSQKNDHQCASGWPCQAWDMDSINGCPAGTPPIPGVCKNELGGGSKQACTSSAPGCPFGENCRPFPFNGCPKYGDYNGNACINGAVYVAWASGTPPLGVIGAPPPGINVYADRLNYAFCGNQKQPCCFHGPQCKDASLACGPDNTCVTCGDSGQPCCAGGAKCQGALVCNAQSQCEPAPCGALNQACCGPNATCQPGFTCDINSKCVCGGKDQLCCDQQNGGTCNDPSLACDHRDFFCRTTCGHQGQKCCPDNSCNGGLICAGGVCACGGPDQPCCTPDSTCNFGLKCAAGFCKGAAGNCAQCEPNFASCLNRCGNEACRCLCRNDRCDCFQQNSCGKPCIMEDCSKFPQ